MNIIFLSNKRNLNCGSDGTFWEADVTFKKTIEIEKFDDTKTLIDTDNKLRDDITFKNVR